MIARALQFISTAALLTVGSLASAVDLQPGSVAHLTFHDVDGHELSTAAGHVTIIAVVTRESEAMANQIADQVPNRCMGNQKYRYITLVNFQRKLAWPVQGLTRTIIRQRLDAEARKLKPEYAAKKITHDPREDVLVVADFDGSAVTQLGLAPESDNVSVFVFNGRGKLVQRWSGVPPGDSLGKAIADADER